MQVARAVLLVLAVLCAEPRLVKSQPTVPGLLRVGDRVRIDSATEGRIESITTDSIVVSVDGITRRLALGKSQSLEFGVDRRHMATGALVGTLLTPGPGTLVGLGVGALWKSAAWVPVSHARLKVESMFWSPKTGSLTSLTPDSIHVRSESGDLSIPKRSVQSVSASMGR